MTTAHRPQGDGQTERANRQILEYLRASCNALGTDWDQPAMLAQLEFVLNSHRSSATAASAFELHLARTPIAPTATSTAATGPQSLTADLLRGWQRAKDALREAQDKMVPDVPSQPHPVVFQAGDKVMLHTRNYPQLRAHKLSPTFRGPFTIKAMKAPTVAELELPRHLLGRIHATVNVEQLKRFVDPDPSDAPPAPLKDRQGHNIHIIDRIVDERRRGRTLQYRIRWRGYGPDDDTWEPATKFKKFPDLIADWTSQQPASRRSTRRGGERG